MKTILIAFALATLAGCTSEADDEQPPADEADRADVIIMSGDVKTDDYYLHSMRGSNDRLDVGGSRSTGTSPPPPPPPPPPPRAPPPS